MTNLLSSYREINNQLTYKSGIIKLSDNKKVRITYADYIASGLLSPVIEQYLQKYIYPLYSNTHSNAHNGILMKKLLSNTKEYLRSEFNISDDYQIIFTGSGTTGAINHLVNSIDYNKYSRIVIYLSIYEHYSNHIPWMELLNKYSHIKIEFIPFIDNSGIIDLNYLNDSINNLYYDSNNSDTFNYTLVICSITACSNINGSIIPLDKIREILNSYPNNNRFFKYFFADYACSAPYVKIDGAILDAFFISPHKFIGGPCTPGLLIGRKCLFSKDKPFCSGGGCVKKGSSTIIEYEPDIERRESAGTPNIIGIIKIKKIFQLKKEYYDIIHNNEKILSELIKLKIEYYELKYKNFKSVLYDDEYHLPIFSFHLTNLHYNLIVILFNDLFGIQTRGGIGCCGLLAEYIEQKYKYRGWCRISFHWLMDKKTITNIFNALEYIIKNGYKYKDLYTYDQEQNLFIKILKK